MIKLIFIRHGATAGNLARRYIGSTDEPLSAVGITQIEALREKNFAIDQLFVSPMLRTKQSAELLFPGRHYHIVDDLRETDFGIFEGKTADELAASPEYEAWLRSACAGPVPGGEAVNDFKARCRKAFDEIMAGISDNQTVAFVIHGGVIMAIMEAYAVPQKSFYDYHIANGDYLMALYDGHHILLLEEA